MKNTIQILLAVIAALSRITLIGTIGAADLAIEQGTTDPQYWEIKSIASIAIFGGSIKTAELIERSKTNERINNNKN